MEKKNLESILTSSISVFLKKDVFLLDINANERSMTHKFAEYLQQEVGSQWNVDCEYNRDFEDAKFIYVLKSKISEYEATEEGKDLERKSVFPDIIIHNRGSKKNLLVIEAKKSSASDSSIGLDKDKLVFIKSQLGYEYAAFLTFDIESKNINYEFI